MRKASTRLPEQGTQTPSPAPDLIPAETKNQPRTHIGIGTANGGTSAKPIWREGRITKNCRDCGAQTTGYVDTGKEPYALCINCAKTKGVNDQTGFSLADLLLGLGASQELEQSVGGVDAKCPTCGFTHADFKKSGRLGCSECYVTFAEGLGGLIPAGGLSRR